MSGIGKFDDAMRAIMADINIGDNRVTSTDARAPRKARVPTKEAKAWHLNEFCKVWSIGETTVRQEIKDGRLKAKRLGRAVIITDEDARRWFNALPSAKSQKKPLRRPVTSN